MGASSGLQVRQVEAGSSGSRLDAGGGTGNRSMLVVCCDVERNGPISKDRVR